MKINFEIKGVKVDVEGDVPDALVELASELAKAAQEELAKLKAKRLAEKD